jgi:hypothetical protein
VIAIGRTLWLGGGVAGAVHGDNRDAILVIVAHGLPPRRIRRGKASAVQRLKRELAAEGAAL